MQKGDPTVEEMESALLRLMPVAVSQAGQERMEGMIDGLAGEVRVGHFRGWKIFVGGAKIGRAHV